MKHPVKLFFTQRSMTDRIPQLHLVENEVFLSAGKNKHYK